MNDQTPIINPRQWLADAPSMEDALALKQQIWNERPDYPFTEKQWDQWVIDCRRVEAMLWFVELLASASGQIFVINPPPVVAEVEHAPEGDDQRIPFYEGDILTCPYCKSECWAEDEFCEECGAVYDLVDGWSKPTIDGKKCEDCGELLADCTCGDDPDDDETPDDLPPDVNAWLLLNDHRYGS